MDLNNVNLSGRLTGDPQGKRTGEGRSVTWFRIAVHRDAEHPDFFRVVCFDRLADTVLRYLHKSSRVIIEGRLAQRERDGQSQVEVVATDVHFLETVRARDPRPADDAPPEDGADAPAEVELDPYNRR